MSCGIITFHAAHNFGSMLQAYALKNYLVGKGENAKIINFRTENQKDIYAVLTKRKGLRYVLKNLFSLTSYTSLLKKHDKFESFLTDQLGCYAECNSAEEINEEGYDTVIAGSDQIWNINTNDFEWLYLLEGVSNTKKVSYAVSCGPGNVTIEQKERITTDLSQFDAISVRDNATQSFVEHNSDKKAEVVCDPVFLLDKQQWIQLSKQSSVKLPSKYVFFYTLSCNKKMKKVARQISRLLGMPVLIPHITNQHDMLMCAKRRLDSGPIEFLDMINKAQVVVTSSFHAMLFSIILGKRFYVIDGMRDNRKRDFLVQYGLQKQSIDGELDETLIIEQSQVTQVDYSHVVDSERRKGENFIRRNILDDNM